MVKIKSCVFKKEGVSQKNGKPWKMFSVTIEGNENQLTTFDDLSAFIGKDVPYEVEHKDKYWNLVKVKSGGKGMPDWLEPWCKKMETRVQALEKAAFGDSNDRPPDGDIPF